MKASATSCSTSSTARRGRCGATTAERMQPAHPGDSSYVLAADALAAHDFTVTANTDRPLTDVLADADVLVIAHPSDPKWEFTTNGDSPRLSDDELDAIDEFVRGGGGLIVLGETEQDKYGNNLNDLLARFGIHVESATVQDYEHHHTRPPGCSPSFRRPQRRSRGRRRPPRPRPQRLLLPRRNPRALQRRPACSPAPSPPRRPPTRRSPRSIRHGDGHVVVLADSDLFGDDCIGELDHEALWLNLVYWAAQPSFRGADAAPRLPRQGRPRLGRAEARRRGAARHPAARRLGRPLRARPRPPRASSPTTIADAAARLSRTSLTRRTTSGRSATTSAPGRTPASPSPTSSAPPRPSAPSSTAATGSSTSPSSRCTSRTPPATPASRR